MLDLVLYGFHKITIRFEFPTAEDAHTGDSVRGKSLLVSRSHVLLSLSLSSTHASTSTHARKHTHAHAHSFS